MALIGAMLAWGVMPLLILPTLPGPFVNYPIIAPATYLIGSTLISVTALARTLIHRGPVTNEAQDVQILSDIKNSTSAD